MVFCPVFHLNFDRIVRSFLENFKLALRFKYIYELVLKIEKSEGLTHCFVN